MSDTQQVQKETTMQGKTVLSFTAPTPMWATWLFRIEFILNKGLMVWFTSTTLIPQHQVKEVILVMSVIDLMTWTLARSLGVKKESIEN